MTCCAIFESSLGVMQRDIPWLRACFVRHLAKSERYIRRLMHRYSFSFQKFYVFVRFHTLANGFVR